MNETIKIKLPKTQTTVVVSTYLTTGQSRALQSVLFSSGSFDTEAGKFTGLTGDTFLKMQDKAVEMLVKEVIDKGGNKKEFSKEWLDDLPVEDGNLIFDKINEITGSASLSAEQKKK